MRIIVGVWDEKGKLKGEVPFEVNTDCPCITVFEVAAWLSKKIL